MTKGKNLFTLSPCYNAEHSPSKEGLSKQPVAIELRTQIYGDALRTVIQASKNVTPS